VERNPHKVNVREERRHQTDNNFTKNRKQYVEIFQMLLDARD